MDWSHVEIKILTNIRQELDIAYGDYALKIHRK